MWTEDQKKLNGQSASGQIKHLTEKIKELENEQKVSILPIGSVFSEFADLQHKLELASKDKEKNEVQLKLANAQNKLTLAEWNNEAILQKKAFD